MANIQHLYRGVGDPNDNTYLELTGDAVGNHIYQDLDNSQSIWMSGVYEDAGVMHHAGWERLLIEADMSLPQVDLNEPRFEGQTGYGTGTDRIYIAMWKQDESRLAWRETNVILGGWFVGAP